MTAPHPWVATTRPLGIGARHGLLAVLGPTGLRELRRHGHRAVALHCAPTLDPATVRFVDEIHAATLASGTDSEVAALHASPWPESPVVLTGRMAGAAQVRLELRIPPDLRCLRGHFPRLPLVPGAMLLAWALGFAAEFLGTAPAMRALRSVKFKHVTQPGQALELALLHDPDRGELHFEYASAAGRHAVGSMQPATDA